MWDDFSSCSIESLVHVKFIDILLNEEGNRAVSKGFPWNIANWLDWLILITNCSFSGIIGDFIIKSFGFSFGVFKFLNIFLSILFLNWGSFNAQKFSPPEWFFRAFSWFYWLSCFLVLNFFEFFLDH